MSGIAAIYMIVSNGTDTVLFGREQTLFRCSIRQLTKFGHTIVRLPEPDGQVDGNLQFVVPKSGDLVMGAWFHVVIPGIMCIKTGKEQVLKGELDKFGGVTYAEEAATEGSWGNVPFYCDGIGYHLINKVTLEIGTVTRKNPDESLV